MAVRNKGFSGSFSNVQLVFVEVETVFTSLNARLRIQSTPHQTNKVLYH